MDVKETKKLAVRKYKPQQNGDNTTFSMETGWEVLEGALLKIQKKQRTWTTRENLYYIVKQMDQNKHSAVILERLQTLIYNFSCMCYETLVNETMDAPASIFLEVLNRLWIEYCDQMAIIQNIFLSMDRAHHNRNPHAVSIWKFSLNAFRSRMIDQMSHRVVRAILELIRDERHGDSPDRLLLKSLLRMLSNLQIYDTVFEPEFFRATKSLYENESRVKLQELQVSDYLRHVAKRFDEEWERIDVYLDQSTSRKLTDIVETCFLANNIDEIIFKGAEFLFANKKLEDLKLMYSLFSRVKNGLTSLKAAFTDYIKKVGRSLVADTSRDKSLVQDLMNFKADLDKIISECFSNNEKYIQSEKDAFDYFINTRPNRPAELIAKFMDSKLRMGNKECSEEELDIVMNKVIVLFRFIQGKDVFEAFYKKDLAKRLLLGRSASVDAEKAMLSKLKNECGAGFTQKLEGMFKDMEVSKDFCAAFKQHLSVTTPQTSEVNVSILTMGNWPSYPIMEVNVPEQLSALQEQCSRFYAMKYNGRKLHWQYSLASAILKVTFKQNVLKELDVSLFQAMVLLMFNESKEYSFEEIHKHTKIEAVELKRTLQSLACGKFRILQKSPRGKDVDNGDKFEFNEDFNVNLHRIRISQVQMRETEEEHQQTEEQIFQDRQYQIDAAIVRIMKTRKTLAHNLLISELLKQLQFVAKPVDLKKRIESLMERDYISRDKEDTQIYHYVA